VRYPFAPNSSLVGLRIVQVCPETDEIIEENIPGPSENVSRIFPFPHGLDQARKFGAKSIILVSSVLDSVSIAAKSNFVPVSLAEGSTSLPPNHLAFLEEFDKISIW
jgi:hypothetical protein